MKAPPSQPNPSRKKWRVAVARVNSPELKELLDQGWEPFSVVGYASWPTEVYLRRTD
jgi:hypothetical protein